MAYPSAAGVSGGPQDPDILRGGAWIGVLERAAVAATLLAGSAEGLVVVAAVKGLADAELRAPAAAGGHPRHTGQRIVGGRLRRVALLLRG